MGKGVRGKFRPWAQDLRGGRRRVRKVRGGVGIRKKARNRAGCGLIANASGNAANADGRPDKAAREAGMPPPGSRQRPGQAAPLDGF